MVQTVLSGQATSNLPMLSGEVLGTLLMYELREAIAVPHDRLKAQWAATGLPPDLIPSPRSGRDAFRKATPRRQLQNGLLLNEYKGKTMPENSVMACVLVRATPTRTKTKFTHSNRAAIYLTDENKVAWIEYANLEPAERAYIGGVVDNFQKALVAVDGSQLREKLSTLLRRAHALPFREGAWLVPSTQVPIVQALEQLVPWLDAFTPAVGEKNRITTIAYLATPAQHTQLDRVIKEFVAKEIVTKQVEAARYAEQRRQAKKPVGDGKKGTMLGDLLALQELIGSYEEIMQTNLRELKRQAKYAEQTVGDILNGNQT